MGVEINLDQGCVTSCQLGSVRLVWIYEWLLNVVYQYIVLIHYQLHGTTNSLWCCWSVSVVMDISCAVTERVWEVVSTDASDEEEEMKADPSETKVSVKTEKNSPSKHTKQSSLRSFFKR